MTHSASSWGHFNHYQQLGEICCSIALQVVILATPQLEIINAPTILGILPASITAAQILCLLHLQVLLLA